MRLGSAHKSKSHNCRQLIMQCPTMQGTSAVIYHTCVSLPILNICPVDNPKCQVKVFVFACHVLFFFTPRASDHWNTSSLCCCFRPIRPPLRAHSAELLVAALRSPPLPTLCTVHTQQCHEFFLSPLDRRRQHNGIQFPFAPWATCGRGSKKGIKDGNEYFMHHCVYCLTSLERPHPYL